MKRYISLILVLLVVFSSVPAFANDFSNVDLSPTDSFQAGANESSDFDTDTALKVGGGIIVVGGLVYLGNRFYRRSQAGKLYEQAQAYAEQGDWGQAVETYEETLDIVDDYEDTKSKLAKARDEAEEMYVNLGDEAKEVEKFEEAREYYQLALRYQPNSMRAQNKVDELEDRMLTVHYRRGHNYEVQGNWEEAYQEYQLAYNVDPNYEDLADRYHRSRAQVEGDIPLRALMFVVNRTGQSNLERSFINALQSELEAKITDDFYMIDRENIQQIMDEQGQALSDIRDKSLGIDIANLVGAQEIVMGELLELDTSSDEIVIEFELEIIDVEDAKVIKEIEYEYEFEEGIGVNDLNQYMDHLARELVDDKF